MIDPFAAFPVKHFKPIVDESEARSQTPSHLLWPA